jgi:hypothetical protein
VFISSFSLTLLSLYIPLGFSSFLAFILYISWVLTFFLSFLLSFYFISFAMSKHVNQSKSVLWNILIIVQAFKSQWLPKIIPRELVREREGRKGERGSKGIPSNPHLRKLACHSVRTLQLTQLNHVTCCGMSCLRTNEFKGQIELRQSQLLYFIINMLVDNLLMHLSVCLKNGMRRQFKCCPILNRCSHNFDFFSLQFYRQPRIYLLYSVLNSIVNIAYLCYIRL